MSDVLLVSLNLCIFAPILYTNSIMMKKLTFVALLCAVVLSSCKTPKDITYLQDVDVNSPIQTQTEGFIRFQTGDKLNVFVHSRDEQLMKLFNLMSGSTNSSMFSGGNGQQTLAYTIDDNGNIDFPVLGSIKVVGMTRDEVAKKIKSELVNQNLCNDAVVTVNFFNMKFAVLGNTGTGVKEINKDRITLLEAIAMSSDLQIDGMRTNVLVMRQEGDKQVPYRVDLTKTESVYSSPVYYIQQNDVIYIEPNDKFKRNSTVMSSTAYQPAFWMSLATFLSSMGILIFSK